MIKSSSPTRSPAPTTATANTLKHTAATASNGRPASSTQSKAATTNQQQQQDTADRDSLKRELDMQKDLISRLRGELDAKEARIKQLETTVMPRPMSRERLPPMDGFGSTGATTSDAAASGSSPAIAGVGSNSFKQGLLGSSTSMGRSAGGSSISGSAGGVRVGSSGPVGYMQGRTEAAGLEAALARIGSSRRTSTGQTGARSTGDYNAAAEPWTEEAVAASHNGDDDEGGDDMMGDEQLHPDHDNADDITDGDELPSPVAAISPLEVA